MNKRIAFGLMVALSLTLAPLVFCEESPVAATAVADAPSVMEDPVMPAPGSDVSWVWGEVKSVDAAAAAFTISYMDYQTDEEKELILTSDAETKFDNIASLAEIKVGDTVSVDYAVKGDKNIVKNISVEKMEELPEAPSGDVPVGIDEPAPVETSNTENKTE